MSTHPNVILALALTPGGLSRKLKRAVLEAFGKTDDDSYPKVKIGDTEYRPLVMEEDYDDGFQIAAKEGDVVLFDMVTYGYGETITWEKLQDKRDALIAWAEPFSKEHACSYRVFVTANYW